MWRRTLVTAALLLVAGASSAAAFDALEYGPFYWRVSGFAKSFASMTQGGDAYQALGLTSRETFWDNATRLRLRSKTMLGEVFELEAHYEIRARVGDQPRLANEFDERYGDSPLAAELRKAVFPEPKTPQLFNLEHELAREEIYDLMHRLDRLYVRLHAGPWDFTIGRAALTWGPGRFWNPTDYLATFLPTEIDKDEKLGVDLLHARVAVAKPVTVEAFAAPVRGGAVNIDHQRSAAGGRLVVRALNADWSLSGGGLYDRATVGVDVDASVGGAGLRGAATRTTVEGVPNRAFYRAIVNADYAFAAPWNPYLAGEYHYNGFGENDPEKYLELAQRPAFVGAYSRGEVVNLGTHYFGVVLSLQPHALVTLAESAIVNLVDGSAYNGLQLTWSVVQNLDVQAGAQNTFGGNPSEFGGIENQLTGETITVPDVYYLYVKYYF